jgi:predicted TIM-barrel enzyme
LAFLNRSAINQPINSFGKVPLTKSPVMDNYDKGAKTDALLKFQRTWDSVSQVQEVQHTSLPSSYQGSVVRELAKRSLIGLGADKNPTAEQITRFGMHETIIPYPVLTGRGVITETYLGHSFLRNADGTLIESIIKQHSATTPNIDGEEIRGSFLKGLLQRNLIKTKY